MKVLHLQDDFSLDECDISIKDILVLVSEYEGGSWEGSGWAYILFNDGHIEEYNLSHCSCYGPLENKAFATWDSRSSFIKDAKNAIGHSGSDRLVQTFIQNTKGIRCQLMKS
jgi:hypothetical protein